MKSSPLSLAVIALRGAVRRLNGSKPTVDAPAGAEDNGRSSVVERVASALGKSDVDRPIVGDIAPLQPDPLPNESPWGRLAAFALVSAAALLLMAGADALSRTGHRGGQALFWAALLPPIAFAAFRLSSAAPGRRERIGTVLLIGIML
jgi:hypothetical protein